MRTLLRFIQKYSDFLLFLVLETVAIILMVQGSGFQRSKIVELNRQISGYMYNKVDGTREFLSLKETNSILVDENTALRNRLVHMEQLLDSSVALSEFREPFQYQFVPGRVIHNSVYKQYNFLTIDRGEKGGVFKDMGVISDQGVVGIVLETSEHYATVIPVINLDFRLSVKMKSNNYAGILQWGGKTPLLAGLNEIPFHVELMENDTIVTSGYSSIFPEGIEVGTIESFSLEKGNFYEISVRLSTDFQRLFHVNVIRNYQMEEQLNLEDQAG
ncbi:MAG: rod shape-determining protein MreC [Bacteroidetes bacterium]|nr:rod shape-determining protein MreC [Bacteroidota bacterium]